MIYSDVALQEFRECFESLELKYEELGTDADRTSLEVRKNNITLQVWFDTDKQSYNFSLVNGGSKSYPSIEEFEKYFRIYLGIHTVFVPKAKDIANKFEGLFEGKSIVYNSFSGNSEGGYTANFVVLNNDDEEVLVKKEDENKFVAMYVNKVKKKIIKKRYYTEDLQVLYDAKTYKDELFMHYKESNISINKIGEFEYLVDNRVRFIVEIDGVRLLYHILEPVITDIELENAFSMEELISKVEETQQKGVNTDDLNEDLGLLDEEPKTESGVQEDDSEDLGLLDEEPETESEVQEDSSTESETIDEQEDNSDSSSDEEEMPDEETDEEETFDEESDEDGDEEELPDKESDEDEIKESTSNTVSLAKDDFTEEFSEEQEEELTDEKDETDDVQPSDDSGTNEIQEDEVFEDIKENDDSLDSENEEIFDEKDSESKEIESSSNEKIQDEVSIEETVTTNVEVEENNDKGDKVMESTEERDYTEMIVEIVKDVNEIPKFVRFSYSDKILDMCIEKAQELGIPVDYIEGYTTQKKHRGMIITEEELNRKIFAKNITDNEDICQDLVNDFFN